MDGPLRVGLVGTSWFAETVHLACLESHPKAVLTAVCGRDRVNAEALAIQRDSSSSRVRLVGSAPWVLRALSLDHAVLAQGTSRILDGYNILNQQFFAADLESEVVIRRVASALADQITTQVGAFFLRRAETA